MRLGGCVGSTIVGPFSWMAGSVAAMTSLLEPIMIVFLAVVVGSIVIALFLPLIVLMDKMSS